MTQKLTKMEIDRVDLVDAGANGRRFALFKRDAGGAAIGEAWAEGLAGSEPEAKSLAARVVEAVSKALGIPQSVDKAMTFAEIVAGREMSEALEEHWTTLQDALWNALYAYDDDNQPLSVEAKKQLVAQNLDEFKAFLLERMDQGISKGDGSTDARLFAAFIAKVGKKVSAARAARLQEAADALAAVLAEVEVDGESAETEKRARPQEEDMTPEELTAAITKANEPLVARIEALETAKASTAEPAEGEGAADPITLEGVAEAVTKLGDRLAAIEKAPGSRQSATADEAPSPVKKSKWAGVLS